MKRGKRHIVSNNAFLEPEAHSDAQQRVGKPPRQLTAEQQEMKDADKDDLDRFDNQALQTAFGGSSGDRGKIIHFSKEVASDQSKVQSEAIRQMNHGPRIMEAQEGHVKEGMTGKTVQQVADDTAKNDAQQKRKKIQLLKQKYLKKSSQPKKEQSVQVQGRSTELSIKREPVDIVKQPMNQQVKTELLEPVSAATHNQVSVKRVAPPPPMPHKKATDKTYMKPNIISAPTTIEKQQAVQDEQQTDQSKVSQQPSPFVSTSVKTPQFCLPQHSETSRIVHQNIPLPPPSSKYQSQSAAVQEILAKKLAKAPPSVQIKQPQLPVDPFEDLSRSYTQQKLNQDYPEKFSPLESEQTVSGQVSQQTPPDSQPPQPQFKQANAFRDWLSATETCLSMLIQDNQSLLQNYLSKKQYLPPLQSKNVGFSPLFARTIEQFVFVGKKQLNQQQKQLLNQIALEYFYSCLNELTVPFLACFVKLGRVYLRKYGKIIGEKSCYYLRKLVLYRWIFADGQLNELIAFYIEQLEISEMDYFWLTMLCPSTNVQLINEINKAIFSDSRAMLSILCLCKLTDNKNMMGNYLRLIGLLCDKLGQLKLIEQVLQHLKVLQIPQKHYQVAKQLKLKLIGMISNPDKPKQQVKEQDGLFGYFNKAITKIKNTGMAEKVEKVSEPQDVIVYDHNLKRYTVNGKVLEEEGSQEQSTSEPSKVPLPPPPPKKTAQSGSPPPPPPNRKNRLPTPAT